MSSTGPASENGGAVPNNLPPAEERVEQNPENRETENQGNQVADNANEQQIAHAVDLFVYWMAEDLVRMHVPRREPVVVARQNVDIEENLVGRPVVERGNFADSIIDSRPERNDRSRG